MTFQIPGYVSSKFFSLLGLFSLFTFFAVTPGASLAATIAVNTTTDELAAPGTGCSLREAIENINNGDAVTYPECLDGAGTGFGVSDTINVPTGTYAITLPGVEDSNAGGDLDITKAVTITGAGATFTIIDGATIDRVFHVTVIVPVTINSLTARNGASTTTSGGGIYSRGALTLENSTVSGNTTTTGSAGGVAAEGAVTLTNSTISGNTAGGGVGGLASLRAVTLTNSNISNNTAVLEHGGILGWETVTLTNSTVNNNHTDFLFGGIWALGAIKLTGSSVSGNSAGVGFGGVFSDASVTLTSSIVNNNTAVNSGGGIGSLGAVTLTNSTVSGNAATTGDLGGVIADGAITITNSTLSGNTAGRDYGGIYSNSTVALTNSTLSGNTAARNYGGIYASGALTVTGSAVSNNSAIGNFGGINSNNAVTIANSTISNNRAGDSYGGVSGGAVTLTNSTVSGNSAGGDFGGIFSNGALTMDSSTISGNMAGSSIGGAIGNVVTITNSTISGNTAGGSYGGMVAQGMTTLTNTTIYGNSGTFVGSGLYIFNGTATLSNTIVANNPGGDCHAVASTLTSGGYNLDSDGTCLALGAGVGDFTSAGFALPALAYNGGTTMTHALLTGSPAIDTGSCVTATDQIGTVRPQGAGCDIGAYEAPYIPPPKPRNHWPFNPNDGGADWLIYPGADETNVNPGTAFKWYKLVDDDGDEITYDPQFCDGFESGECTSWSSVNGRLATLRQAQGDKHLSLRGAEGDVAISGLPRFARNDGLLKPVTTGALLFALGFIGAIRTRRGRAFMLALLLMTSGAVMTACGKSDDDSSTVSAAITCDSVEDGVVCRTQTGLAANTDYSWRVVATDGNGGENISVIRSFTTGE